MLIKCPKCNQELAQWARGVELKIWACNSQQCVKEPFDLTLYYQPNTKIPVVWGLEFGKMHQVSINKASQENSKERKTNE